MTTLQLQVYRDLAPIEPQDWNRMAGPDNPFIEHQFLHSLQEAGCVGAESNWQSRYIVAYRETGEVAGALPFYVKYDSSGEYIFDHGWAEAYGRAGLSYYPKGLVTIPFTPANGNRILIAPGQDRQQVCQALLQYLFSTAELEELSSLHFLFLTDQERTILEKENFVTRFSTQFHWENRGYSNFDDWLQDLRSGRRKEIRKERRRIGEAGIEVEWLTGQQIEREHIEYMYQFYRNTGSRKWGPLYLNRRWFELIRERFCHRILLILAKQGKDYIAGALNFYKGRKLYGRYWGACRYFPYLHFELCYYRPIEYAIENGFKIFEAGAQGEHKFLRGFMAKTCYSSHWMRYAEGHQAIEHFLRKERDYVSEAVRETNLCSPMKQQPEILPVGDRDNQSNGQPEQ